MIVSSSLILSGLCVLHGKASFILWLFKKTPPSLVPPSTCMSSFLYFKSLMVRAVRCGPVEHMGFD